MKGVPTCIVLGAGASRCYQGGRGQMPLQADIGTHLFMGMSMEGQGYIGAFCGSHGLRHSERLGDFIRRSFGLSERSDASFLEFWKDLQSGGYTLETLYHAIKEASLGVADWAPSEFEAIVRTVLSEKVDRSIVGVCDCHRTLAQALEPGDFIVNFNWDSLASDALYHFSRLWFPTTGFGPNIGVLPKYPADLVGGQSFVSILQPHGCVALYALTDPDGVEQKHVIYLPPETYDPGSSMFETLRKRELDRADGGGGFLRSPTTEEQRRFNGGWMRLPSDEWLKPLFLPPTSEKQQYDHWYHRRIRQSVHQLLPSARQIVLAGYSVPPADVRHLNSLFVPAVLHPDLRVVVVNQSNEDAAFRARVAEMFPGVNGIDHSVLDFVSFCEGLLGPDDLREFRKKRGQPAEPTGAPRSANGV